MSADDILNESLRALYIQAEQKDPLDVLELQRKGQEALLAIENKKKYIDQKHENGQAMAFRSEKLTVSRKQRCGQILFEDNDDFDEPLALEYGKGNGAVDTRGDIVVEAFDAPVAEAVTACQLDSSHKTADAQASKTVDNMIDSNTDTVAIQALLAATKPRENTIELSAETSPEAEGSPKATTDALRRQEQREIADLLKKFSAYRENAFLLRHWVKKISGESKVDFDL